IPISLPSTTALKVSGTSAMWRIVPSSIFSSKSLPDTRITSARSTFTCLVPLPVVVVVCVWTCALPLNAKTMQEIPAASASDKRPHPLPDFMVCSPLRSPQVLPCCSVKLSVIGVDLSLVTEPSTASILHQPSLGIEKVSAFGLAGSFPKFNRRVAPEGRHSDPRTNTSRSRRHCTNLPDTMLRSDDAVADVVRGGQYRLLLGKLRKQEIYKGARLRPPRH